MVPSVPARACSGEDLGGAEKRSSAREGSAKGWATRHASN
jgi:hypothetical protein